MRSLSRFFKRLAGRDGVPADSDPPSKATPEVGDVLAGTVAERRPNSLGLDLGGQRGWVSASRLGLDSGGVERGPYQVGHVLPVLVLGTNRDGSLDCDLVIKVGDVLEGTVAERRPNSLGVDLKGWRGWVPHDRLGLEQNEVGDIPYREGDVLRVCVVGINPGQSFNCEPAIKVEVGDELIGTVTEVRRSALRLSVEDQYITLTAGQLGLRDGEVEDGPHTIEDRMIVRVEKVHGDNTLTCAPLIKVGDELPGTIKELRPDSLSLDVEGRRGRVLADNLRMLRTGEVEAGPYKQGHVLPVRVLSIDRDEVLDCAPVIEVGDVLEGTVAELRDNSLGVDIKGWRGWVPRGRLGLGQNEAGDGPYRQGNVLRVCIVGINPGQSFDCEPVIEAGDQIDGVVAELRSSSIGLNIHGRRGWVLAHRLGLRPGEVESGPYEPGGRLRVRVLAPNPDESFDCAPCADVGDELLGTITKVTPNGLRLNVDDQLGLIQAGRLGLPDGDVEGGPYEHEGRMIVRVEEVRPNGTLWVTPHIEVGDLLIGRVAEFHPNSLGLDIDGRRVWLSARSLGLPDGDVENSTHKIKDWMIVRVIDVNAHGSLHCERVSSKATPEELNSYESGQPVKGLVLLADEERGLAIDLEPVVGWVDWAEIPESQHHLAFWNRRIGHTVFGHVATKNAEDGSVAVTLEQASSAAYDLLTEGDVVVGRVTNYRDNNQGGGVFVGFTPDTVSGLVFSGEIPIRHRDNPQSVYQRGDSVSVAAVRVDRESKLGFSIVGALRQRNTTLFGKGDVVSCVVSEVTEAGLQVTAKGANGFIRREELTCSVGDAPSDQVREGEQLEAVVIAHESSDGMPYLSIRRLAPDWLDRIAEMEEGQEVRGVVISSGPRFAIVDIGAVNARFWRDEQSLSPDSEMRLKAGNEITAVISRINHDGDGEPPKVALSMRQADPSYDDAVSGVADDSIIEGIVARVEETTGLRVDIGPVTGFVQRSELPVARGKALSDVYEPGDTVRVKVFWVDPDEKRAGLSVGRADPLRYGLKHPEFLDGVSVEARCVEIGDRVAKFEIPGSDLQGRMQADEFSLEAGTTADFTVGDTIAARVLGFNKDYTDQLNLSARRAQDGWSEACARIRKGESLPGTVVTVRPGGVRVDLGPLTDWVSQDEMSLDVARPGSTHSVGQPVAVYVVDAWDFGKRNPRLKLSLRRAMAEWPLHVRRIRQGSLMTGRVFPKAAQQRGSVRIDLGPVNGLVSPQELAGATADDYAQEKAWSAVNVVVRRFGIHDIEAEVSIDGYGDRWKELAQALSHHGMIKAEYVGRTGSEVHVDLGYGLLCRVPASEWAEDAGTAFKSLDSYSIGDPIDVRVVSINKDGQVITGTLLTEAQQQTAELAELLLQGAESDQVEFKPVLYGKRDDKGTRKDEEMPHGVLKSIAAFLNTNGGTVVVGVKNDGSVIGLERDGFANGDDASHALSQFVERRMNPTPSPPTLSMNWVAVDGQHVLVIKCGSFAPEVVYLRDMTEKGGPRKLYHRLGTSTEEVRTEEIHDFVSRRRRLPRPQSGEGTVPEGDSF